MCEHARRCGNQREGVLPDPATHGAIFIEDLRGLVDADQLEEAILTLERLARGRGRRRGRPPAWMTELKRRGRPPGSKNKAKESTAA